MSLKALQGFQQKHPPFETLEKTDTPSRELWRGYLLTEQGVVSKYLSFTADMEKETMKKNSHSATFKSVPTPQRQISHFRVCRNRAFEVEMIHFLI